MIADIAILTKLLPTRIATMNLSSFEIKRCTLCARFIPREIMWRKRILLKATIEVSEAEKKKDTTASVIRSIKIPGEMLIVCILFQLKLIIYV